MIEQKKKPVYLTPVRKALFSGVNLGAEALNDCTGAVSKVGLYKTAKNAKIAETFPLLDLIWKKVFITVKLKQQR
ncbi:hypothetical protein GF407_05510 [candidate division KSB1 bacterium]|nr:hypothetical protein [candidate division KSB1 bacterium]